MLRRQPSGKLLSPTAHRIDREYLILAALNKYNDSLAKGEDGVPVPQVHCLCMDNAVVGAGFYVMEYLEGRIFTDVRLKGLHPDERILWYAVPWP